MTTGGLKQKDIKPCIGCGQGVARGHFPTFFRLNFQYMVVDFNAVQRQHGLEMSMGAAAPLAQHMGPDEDMAKAISDHDVLVCMECAMSAPLAQLWEQAGDGEKEEDDTDDDDDT